MYMLAPPQADSVDCKDWAVARLGTAANWRPLALQAEAALARRVSAVIM